MNAPDVRAGRNVRRGVMAAAGLVIVLAVAAVAATRDDPAPPSPYADAHAGLCDSRRLAGNGDADGARRAFFDRSHAPLHRLAADAGESDRAAAARLLEAKNAVERDFGGGPANLQSDLDRLLATTRSAIDVTGAAEPPPCDPEAES